MPEGVRYMSEAAYYLKSYLPTTGKYILDKSLTGCGGTEFFINSGLPLVLISPRSGVLGNKYRQHPECHLFRESKRDKLSDLKTNLRDYLSRCWTVPLYNYNLPLPKIFVTLDSAKYVIEELKHRGNIDRFFFLVDEFQCLVSDAPYKGKTDLEFLKMIDSEASNICYMSATPIKTDYLDGLTEFQNCDYHKMIWDPDVVVEPTVKEIMMGKGESPFTIFSGIINQFRKDGYFAKKIYNGKMVEAKEAVVFVNEVKTIAKIILKNNLKPEEVTILVSESNDGISALTSKGFKIETQNTDRQNPRNTPFTFCSKSSFEGRDFYSTNAFTYIFIDGSKDWETHDIAIEIPQMLGRQRLDENPFKYNAVIYYRTKPHPQTAKEYMADIQDKLTASQCMLDSYNQGNETYKRSLIKMVKNADKNNPYKANYLNVIDTVDGGCNLDINFLAVTSDHTLAYNKEQFYKNPLLLTTGIQNQISTANTKSNELREFEKLYNQSTTFEDRMRLYCQFLEAFPQDITVLHENPFIEEKYHVYYRDYGPDNLRNWNYDESAIIYSVQTEKIIDLCRVRFKQGQGYSADDVKRILQSIYDEVGLQKNATAVQITQYLKAELKQISQPDGSRPRLYVIL